MATIYVDGEPYEVHGGNNLLHDCLSLGLDIPYFCWHPALGSIGACRACAVKQYNGPDDKKGRIVMACMSQSTDKTYISINDEEAKEFRKSVVEWLMANHPHDCPVCEEGGHCHLQDMTVMVQHNQRRYRFTKSTHLNQDLGPFINHEMNRCIACYRCLRFYRDYAGGTDFGVYGAHDNLYFGREQDGPFTNEFSGNLIEVCPTGVFTDKTHSERYNRKWDMQFAPSICQQCSIGCNISPGERYGELRRIENRYHGQINHYFLCDRGRFGHGYVNRKDRPRRPFSNNKKERIEFTSADDAVLAIAKALRGCKRIIGIGSPRASIQSNFVLRQWVGAENFSSGISGARQALTEHILHIFQDLPLYTPALREIETCDTAIVLGEDVTQTAPRIALALRQSVKHAGQKAAQANNIPKWQAASVADITQQDKSPLYIASFTATRLDDIATDTYHGAREDLARLGFAVAHAIDATAPEVPDLSTKQQALATRIANDLLAADQPIVVSGTSCASFAVVNAAVNIALALYAKGRTNVYLSLCLPRVNSMGVAMLEGHSVEEMLTVLEQGDADGVIVMENDIFRRANNERVNKALTNAKVLVAIDHQHTTTCEQANFVLPAGSFIESDGTVINMEGRAQRYFPVYDPAYYDPSCIIKESWSWLHAIQTTISNNAPTWIDFDQVTQQCATAIPILARIGEASPDASFRVKGLKIARAPRRYSGRTAMRANLSVYEPSASQDQDSALAFSMEGFSGPGDAAAFVPFAWAPGWNSPQAWTKFQDEVGGKLRTGDTGIRLLEPVSTNEWQYFTEIPAAFTFNPDLWRVVPLYHIFGSDELICLAPAMQTMITGAYVAIATADAMRLNVTANSLLTVALGQRSYSLRVYIDKALPPGMIGLPMNVPGIPPILSHVNARLISGAS